MARFDLPLQGRVYSESGLRVNADYTLVLDMMSDVADFPVILIWRCVGDDGRVAEGVETVVSDGLSVTQRMIFNLPAGVLVHLTVGIDANGGDLGEVRARVTLGSRGGANDFGLLLVDGYVGGGASVMWPYAPHGTADAQRGKWQETINAAPAAGAEHTLLLLAGVYIDITAISAVLITDANVANRLVNFWVATSGLIVVRNASANGIVQAASLTVEYHALAGMGAAAVATATDVVCSMPFITAPSLGEIGTVTDNIQVGDQYSDMWVAGYRRFAFV
jgi:hypothetical protein